MSSMDQAFVKAFSRRRLNDPGRQLEQRPSPAETADGVAPGASVSESPAATPGNVKEGWQAGLAADQIARADLGEVAVPRPHVDAVVAFDPPRPRVAEPPSVSRDPVDVAKNHQPEESPATHADPLQHIHTAYAGAFGDPSLVASATSLENLLEFATELPKFEGPASEVWQRPSPWTDHGDPPHRHESTHRHESNSRHGQTSAKVADDHPIADLQPETLDEQTLVTEAAAAVEATDAPEVAATERTSDVATPEAKSSYVPFQPVWEVDVFDVPTPVADLFFEGALFQQIAERMSDAVASGLRSVLVTSTRPGEGRSSVAIGMAMAAAAAGIRVALVDADTESPSLADELRLDLQYGWVDVIRRGLPIREVAVQAVEDGVTLIPLMPPGIRPAANAFETMQLIDLLKDNFELIILDGPTSLTSGLNQCASKVDSAVIVRDVTQTDNDAVSDLANRLHGAGVRGIGVVENFI